jgi:hypothetical protein
VISPNGPAPERPDLSSRWSQPVPRRTDENLKHVHRKIDRNLKSGSPLVDNSPQFDRLTQRVSLPGAPSLLARLDRLADRPGTAPAPSGSDEAAQPEGTDDDVLARAWEERMAKQWEDVTSRLLRDFAPDGGTDAETVLQHIAQQRRQLDSATVRDYLPVLVDKAVRRLLDPDAADRG